ncbi:MAG: YceI family protein [Alphaproteobacteria bacterium]|nr:YceI family protein [Alphaproteobacteria bacterium]
MRWLLYSLLIPGSIAASLSLAAADPAPLYRIDQRYGNVGFAITSLGMFTTEGRFDRFQGELLLDADHPERTHIDVSIDGSSVEMPIEDEVNMLRSAAYFDTARYPTERFVSSSIERLSPIHYVIHGTLQIRGVSQPQDLDAVMSEHHVDAARHIEWADFVVTGQLRRSSFGMVADRTMVSDVVRLNIRIRLTVAAEPKSG